MTKSQTPTDAAFEAWWAEERLRTWNELGCAVDRGPIPSAEWSEGFRPHALSGWQAHAALSPTALGAIDHETERADYEAWFAALTFETLGKDSMSWAAWRARAALAPAAPAPSDVWRCPQCDSPSIEDTVMTRLRCHDCGGEFLSEVATPPVPHASVDQARDLVVDQAVAPSGECHAAADVGSAWIAVSERRPPAAQEVIVYGLRPGREWPQNTKRVHVQFINTRPWESVEDYEITHWMPLPPPPVKEQS